MCDEPIIDMLSRSMPISCRRNSKLGRNLSGAFLLPIRNNLDGRSTITSSIGHYKKYRAFLFTALGCALSTSSSSRISVAALSTSSSSRTLNSVSYFTCRHTYEETLMEELKSASCPIAVGKNSDGRPYVKAAVESKSTTPVLSTPCPGLVRMENEMDTSALDPVYALQSIPNAVEVNGPSINALARGVLSSLSFDSSSSLSDSLRASPRGSLVVHALVPGMFKGSPKPKMERRVRTLADVVVKDLRKTFPCARKQSAKEVVGEEAPPQASWILQLLLLSPEEVVVSLSPVTHLDCSLGTWPSLFPAGLADAEDEDLSRFNVPSSYSTPTPSSAYRKLMEGLSCIHPRTYPLLNSEVVDLGASPGGWTAIMRKLGCRVLSVDRSELSKELMRDASVSYISGDAFTYTPPPSSRWMVSDIIAFPERVCELLRKWCSLKLADVMVVTMKFKGDKPQMEALREACGVAERRGYGFRAKHFFNNKNEVTLMVVNKDADFDFHEGKDTKMVQGFQPRPMFPVIG